MALEEEEGPSGKRRKLLAKCKYLTVTFDRYLIYLDSKYIHSEIFNIWKCQEKVFSLQ